MAVKLMLLNVLFSGNETYTNQRKENTQRTLKKDNYKSIST